MRNRYYVDFNNVYFTGPANSAAFQNRYINETQNRLTGVFSPYEVITTVFPSPGNAPVFNGINVAVVPGSNLGRNDTGNLVGGSAGIAPYGSIAGLLATFPVRASSDTITHENFHLIAPTVNFSGHNQAVYSNPSIMNAAGTGSRQVTGQNFDEAFRGRGMSGLPGVKNDIGIDFGLDDFSMDFGAAGGSLLYPNKPNNNTTRSVYSKP